MKFQDAICDFAYADPQSSHNVGCCTALGQ